MSPTATIDVTLYYNYLLQATLDAFFQTSLVSRHGDVRKLVDACANTPADLGFRPEHLTVCITREGELIGEPFQMEKDMAGLVSQFEKQMATLNRGAVSGGHVDQTGALLLMRAGSYRMKVRITQPDGRECVCDLLLTRNIKASLYRVASDPDDVASVLQLADDLGYEAGGLGVAQPSTPSLAADVVRDQVIALANEYCEMIDREFINLSYIHGEYCLVGSGVRVDLHDLDVLFTQLACRQKVILGELEYGWEDGEWTACHRRNGYCSNYVLNLRDMFPPRPADPKTAAMLTLHNGELFLFNGSVHIKLTEDCDDLDLMLEIYSLLGPHTLDCGAVVFYLRNGVMHATVSVPGMAEKVDWLVHLPGDLSEIRT